MTEIPVKKSDSNDSNDSWTLLDDNSDSEEQIPDNSSEIIEIQPETESAENQEQKTEDKDPSDGFLVFDEYLQERLLDQTEKPAKKRPLKAKTGKKEKKSKARTLGIHVFFAIILALSAFATLCSTLSQPRIENGVPKEAAKARSKPIVRKEEMMKAVNQTRNETAIPKLVEDKKQCPKNTAPFPKPEFETFLDDVEEGFKLLDNIKEDLRNKPKSNTLNPKKLEEFFRKPKNFFKFETKAKSNKFNWTILKEVLMDINVHVWFSLVVTNIYLITLLTDLSRRSANKRDFKNQLKKELLRGLRKSGSSVIKKRLFRELPFHEFKIEKYAEATGKSPPVNVNLLNEKKNRGGLFKSLPFLDKKPTGYPLMLLETGISECQRRFDELDQYQKKFDNLKLTQKNRVKLLKQKFKNEVTHIRDTEEESDARAEKINRTSQRFIRRLKFNREKYLLELKKMRDLRQKSSSKDVASGSYAVSIPAVYDYGEKFKSIQQKFENNQGKNEWKFQ